LHYRVPNIYPYTKRLENKSLNISDFVKLNVSAKKHPFEPVVDLDPTLFCGMLDQLQLECFQENLVALWKYDAEIVQQLSLEDVIETINKTTIK
jgi:hypothetical protein